MSAILDMLRKCASEYRKREEERVNKIKEEAKKTQVEKKRKPRKRKSAEEKKAERLKRINNPRSFFKEPEPDSCVEHAKPYLEGQKPLYGKPQIIPLSERAHCVRPWCMHNVNGHCVHRECIIDKYKKNEAYRYKGK